jgi:hypothetical protein
VTKLQPAGLLSFANVFPRDYGHVKRCLHVGASRKVGFDTVYLQVLLGLRESVTFVVVMFPHEAEHEEASDLY